MTQDEIFVTINVILDEWDPIGVNPSDRGKTYNEYYGYIGNIIHCYIDGKAIHEFLSKLSFDLSGHFNEEYENATNTAASEIILFLSKLNFEELKKIVSSNTGLSVY